MGGAQQLGVVRSTLVALAQRNLLRSTDATRARPRRRHGPARLWPPALTSELANGSQRALYGAAGRLPADGVVWPSFDVKRRGLAGAVRRFHPRLPPNALHFTADAIQHQQAAIWVYQRSDPPFAPTGTTLEVAHCAFAGVRGGDLVRPNSPMWFFVVPGSGVSVDVGRTLHASPERFGAARVGRMTRRSCPATTAILTSSCAT